MKRRVHIALVSLISILPPCMLHAGGRTNARAIGMGGTFGPVARGISALGINPANLGLRDNPRLGIQLLPAGLRIGSDLISYDIYNEYFTGVKQPDGTREPRNLTAQDKTRILSEMGEGLRETNADLEVTWFGMSLFAPGLGGLGLSISDHVGGKLNVPKDYFRFFLFGLDSSGSRYVFDGSDVGGWWWRELNISVGGRLPASWAQNVTVGIGVKFIHGYGVVETERYRATIANKPLGGNQYEANLSFDYGLRRAGIDFFTKAGRNEVPIFPEPAGSGFGVDLGAATTIHGIAIHASIANIGSIRWHKNVRQTVGTYELRLNDPFAAAQKDSIESALRGTTTPGSEFSTALPTTLRIGAATTSASLSKLKAIPGEILVAAEYEQGLTSSMGNNTTPRVAVGAEYRPISVLPLRMGLSAGGGSGFRWSAGFGLDLRVVTFDFATENLGILFFPGDLDMLSAAFTMEIRI